MVDVINLKALMDLQDQAAIGRALIVKRIVSKSFKRGLQGRKTFARGLGAGEFFMVQGQGAIFVIDGH